MASSFGQSFAAHMSIAWYRNGAWSPPGIKPLAPLSLHPAAHVLHYASTCFEGLKAYRRDDGGVHVFRLDRHIERMRNSARLLCLPEPDPEKLEQMIVDLVDAVRAEIPPLPGALYLRPVLIGVDPNIGAAAKGASEACLYVLASPVGDYFAGGQRPLRVLIDDRAWRSTPDFGQCKTGGNYAAALRAVLRARERYDADQVLFCPGGDVQETGAANFLLLGDGRLLTKPLDGTILPGVTRASLLELAAADHYEVEERSFGVAELLDWISQGEAALSGTAAVLAGVGNVIHADKEYRVGNGEIGPHTRRLRERLTTIQNGSAPDELGWRTEI